MFLVVTGSSAPVPAAARTLLVVGDSLSAAYGMEVDNGWVHLLQQRLRAEGLDYRVVNASLSGDTTAGGLARLPRLLRQHRPELVIVALGANDGLRGLPLAEMKRNIDAMIRKAREAGARVLLVGMALPPNYGRRYTEGFARVYKDLARARRVPLVPFLLDGVAIRPEYMQPDRYHPNAKAQPLMLENVWKVLEPLLYVENQ